MEIGERIPEGSGGPALAAAPPPRSRRIGLPRALGEILAVYVPSFGLGVFTALVLLHNPSLGENDRISGWLPAIEEILQYVMQASVTIFGVAFFCLQRGVTLPMLFGKLKRVAEALPTAVAGWSGYGWPGYGYPGYPTSQPSPSRPGQPQPPTPHAFGQHHSAAHSPMAPSSMSQPRWRQPQWGQPPAPAAQPQWGQPQFDGSQQEPGQPEPTLLDPLQLDTAQLDQLQSDQPQLDLSQPEPTQQVVPAEPTFANPSGTPTSSPGSPAVTAAIPGWADQAQGEQTRYQPQPQQCPPWQQSHQPPAYGYFPGVPRPPQQRSRAWQFSRAYFISMSGVLGFLISVVIYTNVTHQQTGAPDQGNSPLLVLVGLMVALAAGFGEEMLITGLVTNALEHAGMVGKRAWVIYLVAICLRVPFHLYYGWASLGVIIFTVVNIWVYRRWRLLWPIILAHATYDFFEYVGGVVPQAVGGLLILGLALGTLIMLIWIISIENSDRRARRRYARFAAEQGLFQDREMAPVPANG